MRWESPGGEWVPHIAVIVVPLLCGWSGALAGGSNWAGCPRGATCNAHAAPQGGAMGRNVRTAVIAIAAVLALTVGLASAAFGTPIPLVVSQSTAFSVLGHSCGGIQEKAYATGFDPTSGFPTGDVYLSTSCGGSGRGGGYHTTTYSAWVGTTWDLTGALVSYVALTSAPTVEPTFSAFDQYGNEVYNQSNSAYL